MERAYGLGAGVQEAHGRLHAEHLVVGALGLVHLQEPGIRKDQSRRLWVTVCTWISFVGFDSMTTVEKVEP